MNSQTFTVILIVSLIAGAVGGGWAITVTMLNTYFPQLMLRLRLFSSVINWGMLTGLLLVASGPYSRINAGHIAASSQAAAVIWYITTRCLRDDELNDK